MTTQLDALEALAEALARSLMSDEKEIAAVKAQFLNELRDPRRRMNPLNQAVGKVEPKIIAAAQAALGIPPVSRAAHPDPIKGMPRTKSHEKGGTRNPKPRKR